MLTAGRLVDAKYAPQLIVLVLLVGLVPRVLFLSVGHQSLMTAFTFLTLVLLTCLIGFLTRRFRAFGSSGLWRRSAQLFSLAW